MARLCLRMEVPLCSFRPFTSRDYQDSYPAPPPSTLFGMLLSWLGVEAEHAARFFGNRLGIAIAREAELSRVLRKMRRDAANNEETKQGIPQFRPEYQEILVGLSIFCLLDDREATQESLVAAAESALDAPETIERYGGLSLGESPFLVDAILRSEPPRDCLILQPDDHGTLTMPVWTDFSERACTRLQRFELVCGALERADILISN